MPKEKDITDTDEADISLARAKLLKIEADVKEQANQLDLDKDAFMKDRKELDASIAAFHKKHKLIDAADSFNHMVKLVDEIYTMYVLHHGTHAGLYDSIKLLLDARSKFLSEQK